MKKPALKPVSRWTKAAVVIAGLGFVWMVFNSTCNKTHVVVPVRPTDEDVKEKTGNVLEDYGIYMNHLEKVVYQNIEDSISQFIYRGIEQGSRMMDAIETEQTDKTPVTYLFKRPR